MSFRRYPAYRPSHIAHLGDVPEHWQVVPVKRCLKSITQGWSPQCENYPAEAGKWGVLKVGCVNGGSFDPSENKALPSSLEPLPELSIRKGDVLVSRANTRELVGSVAVADVDFERLMLCDKLYRLRVDEESCEPAFIAHCLSTPASRGVIEAAASGASSSMLNIGQAAITGMFVAIPPLKEQQVIVAFVRGEAAKIDELVKEQQRLIDLLKEKRQAVVARAVTKGLDLTDTLTDSGVAWLGKVPTHWQTSRLANLFADTDERGSDELPVLTVSIHDGVSDDELDEEALDRKVTRSDDKTKYKRVAPGDLVYNMMRAWQGGFGSVTVEGMVSPAYVVARPRTEFPTSFIERVLRTPNAIEEMRGRSRGVTDFRLRLYWEEFKDIVVPLPPKDEVEAIMAHLDDSDRAISDTISAAEDCISILRERRSALISAAITGKIDVRTLSAESKVAA